VPTFWPSRPSSFCKARWQTSQRASLHAMSSTRAARGNCSNAKAGKAGLRSPSSGRTNRLSLPAVWRHLVRSNGSGTLQTFTARELQQIGGPAFENTSLKRLLTQLLAMARSREHCHQLGEVRFRFKDQNGAEACSNIEGAVKKRRTLHTVLSWHAHQAEYRLRLASSRQRRANNASIINRLGKLADTAVFEIERTVSVKRVSVRAERSSVVLQKPANLQTLASITKAPSTAPLDRWLYWCRAGVLNPLGGGKPTWSLIYLHGFSCSGTEYLHKMPHYFYDAFTSCRGLRVVLPTAPLLEQTCFRNWNVWSEATRRWRRIRFRAWFDYLTDRCGSKENEIRFSTLLEARAALHRLIHDEAKRVGGLHRVIIGGASQGCCTALDAALTIDSPDGEDVSMGGFIGVVGHHMSCTPLEDAGKSSLKRKMPIHLYHESTDKEMRWDWVRQTVQRLRDAGLCVNSTRARDPTGSGHHIQGVEGVWIRRALRQIMGATPKVQ